METAAFWKKIRHRQITNIAYSPANSLRLKMKEASKMKILGGILVVTFLIIFSGCATDKQQLTCQAPPQQSAARRPASQAPIALSDVPAKIEQIRTECTKPKKKPEYSSPEFEELSSCFENQINEVDDLIIAVWSAHLNNRAVADDREDHRLERELKVLRKELNNQLDSWLEN